MPIIKSAVKKMKQDQRRYARNLQTKRTMRTAIKSFETKPSFDALREAQSKIDTAVKKNVLSGAAAARRMSHLSSVAKKAGVKIVAVKKAATPAIAKPTTKPTTKKPVVKKATAKTTTKPKSTAKK
ncbi:30S ribosomal protein S20 [Candidatus Saccharibacteria bacterium]|nr:30S ribosomal protein S20 [Candidatus Saccharibacteria bacterium]